MPCHSQATYAQFPFAAGQVERQVNFELVKRGLILGAAVVVARRELFQRVLEALSGFLEPLLLVQRVAVVEQLAHQYQADRKANNTFNMSSPGGIASLHLIKRLIKCAGPLT